MSKPEKIGTLTRREYNWLKTFKHLEPHEQKKIEEFEKTYGGSFYLNRWQNGVAGKFETPEEFRAYSPFEQLRKLLRGLRPNIEDHVVFRYFLHR